MKLQRLSVVTALTTLLLVGTTATFALDTPTDFERTMQQISAQKISEHDKLWRIFDAWWQYQMHEYPEWATSAGYPGQNGRWTDMSMQAIERRKKDVAAPLIALKSINREALSNADKINYDIFYYKISLAAEGTKFPDELMPINQLEGVQESPASGISQNPTNTVKDYEDILQRLRGVPTLIDQSIALMQAGLKAGVTPPRITLRDVPQQIQNQIFERAEESPLLEPFKKFPSTIADADRKRLLSEASTIYSTSIVPSYKKLHSFFTTEYLPNTRESLALSDLPNGKAWYEHNLRTQTATNMTAEQIHNIGLSEVARLRKEMDSVIAETKFQGTFAEFSNFMRTDKRFFFDKPADLIESYRDIAKRIDPELMKQFGKLPRLQYGVEPVPSFSEKSQPTAYYRPGTIEGGRAGVFYANTYNIGTRPKWEMEALTLHEAVPGHHLQIALGQEMENMPEFRKHGHFTSFSEGWALYAEGLGSDLGMYKDPYARYGQLTYDMWRSVRLVLDTGIHSMGWSRDKAINFFKENCSKSEHDITVEVDRYIVWPGQACAYKIGQLTFRELRDKAENELGTNFDIRKFHDAALGMGTLPLDTLRTQMTLWVSEQKRNKVSQKQ